MADDGYRAALDGFIADLNRVWRAVGGPSYAQLEYQSEQVLRQRRTGEARFVVLAPSTTSEILGGRRKQPLKWPWVLTFLTVLRIAAQQGAIDAAVIGTLDEWKRKHEAVLARGRASRQAPGQAAGQQASRQAPQQAARVGRHRKPAAYESVSVIDSAPVLPPAAAAHASDSEADALLKAYLTALRRSGGPHWWDGCRDVMPESLDLYLNLESAAEFIRSYETAVIPGLLRAEGYARAVMARSRPDASAAELRRLVELCMQRQWQHRNRRSCKLWAIVEEEALRDQRIDVTTRRAQVGHLIEMMEEPNVALQVVPAAAGGTLTLSEPMTIFRFPERHFGDVVALEQPDRVFYLHERKDTEHYNRLFSSLSVKASSPDNTRDLLLRIRDEM